MREIPRAARAQCHYCTQTLDIGELNTYQKVEGWAKNRGDAGGTNALALRRPLPLWACRTCIDKRTSHRAGDGWEQIDLFAE